MIITTGRQLQEINDPASGEVAYIGLWMGGRQVAACVRLDDDSFARTGYRWHLWAPSLKLFEEARPAALRDEQSARSWLRFIGDCVEGKLEK